MNSIFDDNEVPTLEEIERRYGGLTTSPDEQVASDSEQKPKVGKKRGRKPKIDEEEMYFDKSSCKKKQKVEKINP